MTILKINQRKYTEISGKLPKDFTTAVALLERPYIVISDEDYERIVKGTKNDFLYSSGKIYTFGNADGGKALMPVNQKKYDSLAKKNHDLISDFENKNFQKKPDAMFLQLSDNKETVHYFAAGFIKNNRFTGMIHGCAGGGNYQETLMFDGKFLPEVKDDEPLELDELVKLLEKVTYEGFVDDINTFIDDSIEYSTENYNYIPQENILKIYEDQPICTKFDIIPPSYMNTYFKDSEYGYWQIGLIEDIAEGK